MWSNYFIFVPHFLIAFNQSLYVHKANINVAGQEEKLSVKG